MNIEKIVVGIDFSPYSEVARQRAFELAAASGAKVYLVHALEDSDYKGQESWLIRGSDFHELLEKSRELARTEMERLASEKPAGIHVQYELSDLGPSKALIDAAERHDADLVVIGTHGRTGFERLTLARNTERVVRNSPCSVFVARPSKTGSSTFARILVPTDFSESANDALSVACSLVSENGRVDVLHCWMVYFFPTGYHGLYEEAVSLQPDLTEAVEKQGEELLHKFQTPRSQLRFEQIFNSPTRGIQQTLEATSYDLVVMGSHSRHGVTRILLGSTAEATVRHANCSTLIVRKRPKADET